MSDFGKIKEELQQIYSDPNILKENSSILDKMLLEIINIERRHLYGLDRTSVQRRRGEIESYLDGVFEEYVKYSSET